MAKRFRDEDQIALMQLIPAVAKFNNIKQSEAVSLSKLNDCKQRNRRRFDDQHGQLFEAVGRTTQNRKLPAVNVDLQQGRAIELQGINSIDGIREHHMRHMLDASVGCSVSVMPLWITLDQQMQGIRIRGNQRFGLLSHADIDHSGKVDCGQAAEGVAFCRCVHRRIISKAMTVIEAA